MTPALAGLAALLALAGMAGTAHATALASPFGDGQVGLVLDGTPVAATHDPGAGPLPGDDTVTVAQGLREVEVAWSDAPVGVSVTAGLRGTAVEHGAGAVTSDGVALAVASLPESLRIVWPYAGPDGFDFGMDFYQFQRTPGESPLGWPDTWYAQGWGVGYDRVGLPAQVDSTSDRTLAHQFSSLAVLCDGVQARYNLRPPGCDLQASVYDALPNLALHAELQDASLALDPGMAEASTPGDPLSLMVRWLPEGGPGAPGEAAEEPAPLAERWAATEPVKGPPSGGAAVRPAAEGPSALQAGAAPVGIGPALPLALAALALLAPVVALYRRILPSRALVHPLREQLLQRVRDHPGIHESQLAREMGLRHTHVQYHLRVLEEAGVLETRRFGGLKCIFELGRHSPAEKAMAMVERGRSREVLLAVAGEPGIPQRALARRLGMSESSVKWHLDRLEQAGLVRTERARGAKRAWLVLAAMPEAPQPPAAAVLQLPPAATL